MSHDDGIGGYGDEAEWSRIERGVQGLPQVRDMDPTLHGGARGHHVLRLYHLCFLNWECDHDGSAACVTGERIYCGGVGGFFENTQVSFQSLNLSSLHIQRWKCSKAHFRQYLPAIIFVFSLQCWRIQDLERKELKSKLRSCFQEMDSGLGSDLLGRVNWLMMVVCFHTTELTAHCHW